MTIYGLMDGYAGDEPELEAEYRDLQEQKEYERELRDDERRYG